jgi:protein-S-isoprenylcysteine O-methyltransferase Ste14
MSMAGSAHSGGARRPVSAVPFSLGLAGTASLLAAWLIVTTLRPPLVPSAMALLFATALPMVWLDRTRPRSKGPKCEATPIAWLLGFVVLAMPFTLLQLTALSVGRLGLGWLLVAPLMLVRAVIDGVRPFSGTPARVGHAIRRRSLCEVDANDVRLWLLKCFFMPLYGLSLLSLTTLAFSASFASSPLMLVLVIAYTIDLGIGLSGYVFASAGTSIQPRLAGWLVCLACYVPVMHHWPAFEEIVHQEVLWPRLDAAGAPFLVGATVMLVALVLYISATIAFGLRFANLANRGIITSGPYRLMKHPAYFGHVVNAWALVFVLLPAGGVQLSAEFYAVPVAFTLLYRWRAVTEEQHLSADPDYRAYCDWISRYGLVGRFRRGVLGVFDNMVRRPSRS